MRGIGPTGLNTGSGLNVDELVGKLVTAERTPVENRLNRQEIQVQTHISAMGTFRSALADFQTSLKGLRDSADLHKVAVTSSDDTVLEVSASNDMQAGNYRIEVTQLAQAQRLTSEAFASDLEPIGTGVLNIQFGRINAQSGRFEPNPKTPVSNLEITDANNSLRGIVETINQADAGLRASIINDGSGYRLVLSSQLTGDANHLRIRVNDATPPTGARQGLSRLSHDITSKDGRGMSLIESAQPQDAIILIDGVAVHSPANEIDSAITGLTLKLKAVSGTEPVDVQAIFDKNAVAESIRGFATSYNELNKVMQSIAGYDPQTKQAGPLAGDATVRSIIEQVRRSIGGNFSGINSSQVSLASIGIDTQRDGTLVINDSKLQRAIDENFDEVARLFAKAGGATDPLVKFAGANDNTAMGAYGLRVAQLPTHGYYIGAETGSLRNLEIEADENKFVIKVDGVTSAPVVIPAGIYRSGQDLAEAIAQQINTDAVLKREGASVAVRAVADQLVIESARLGSQSRVEILSAEAGPREAGLTPAAGIDGSDIQGTIGNEPADGSGNRLTGRGKAQGLQVEVLAGKAGDRGEVVFSRGVAEQLDGMLAGFMAKDGIIGSRNKGYNSRIQDIGKQREQLERRLATSEQRLLKQFSSLDALMGKMRETSSFLSNNLAKLPGASGGK